MSEPPSKPIAVGPFQLLRRAGSGATGTVWEASFDAPHAARSTRVAVKVLDQDLAREDRWLAAFRREVQAVAALDHPNIVTVFEHGRVSLEEARQSEGVLQDGSPYLAMEFLQGGTLTRRAGTLHWSDLRAVLLSLLDALAHAHARGVLHRDIKPGNVLLSPDACVLSDFGLGYSLFRDDPEASRVVGTPAYMAPEQFEGEWRDYGPWTDLYSLGCLAFAVAAAKPPFGARRSPSESMLSHLYDEVPPLESQRRVAEGFEDWVRQLMAKDPGDRFQWAADAAWALAALPDPLSGDSVAEAAPFEEAIEPPTLCTLSLPSEFPAEVVRAYRKALDQRAAALGGALDPPVAPPFPVRWQKPSASDSKERLGGVGLGLYGLRTIPLVDRESERDQLWSSLARVHAEGKPEAILLRGGGGTGKSRLAQWLCERAHESGAASVLRAAHSRSAGPGDGLPAMVSRHLCCTGLSRSEVLQRIDDRLAGREGLPPDEVDALTEFIAPASPQERAAGLEAVRFETPAERNALLTRLLASECRSRPVVLWLDDVQWGLDAVFFAIHLQRQRSRSDLPVLMVLTLREDLLAEHPVEREWLEVLAGLEGVRAIDVEPLTPEDRPLLVRELLGLDGELAERVEERTAGNPLFAVQLVGDWVQRGLLVPGKEGFGLRAGASVQLPDDLHSVWSQRIERLLGDRTAGEKLALELAAFLGLQVDRAEWSSVSIAAGAEPSAELVDLLVLHRLARVERSGGEDGNWAFEHEMLRESLKRRAWEDGRAGRLHRLCAGILRQRTSAWDRRRRARHLLAAGDLVEALPVLLEAVTGFLESGDFVEAKVLIQERERTEDRLNLPPQHPARIEGILARSNQARASKQLVQAQELAERAEELARHSGHSELLPAVLLAKARAQGNRGFFAESTESFRAAEELSHSTGTPRTQADCARGLGTALVLQSKLEAGAEKLTWALGVYERLGDAYGIGVSRLNLARHATVRREFDVAEEHGRAALLHARRQGFRSLITDVMNQLGEVARFRGDLSLAEELYREALSRARHLPRGYNSPIFHCNLGLTLAQAERYEAARAAYISSLETLEEQGRLRGSGHLRAMVQAFLLPCHAVAGDWAAVRESLAEARTGLASSGLVDPDIPTMASRAAAVALAAGEHELGGQLMELALGQLHALGDSEAIEAAKRQLEALREAP